jgi:hypothetical protein
MAKSINVSLYVKKSDKRGVAAKSKTSSNKTSKLYKKKYRGQGR